MDEFEQDLSRMLQERASTIPESYDTPPTLLARAHRRRTARLSALVVTVGLVATGTTATVAQIVGRQGSARLVTSPTEAPTTTLAPSTTSPPAVSTPSGRPSVDTVACPVTYTIARPPFPAPVTAPRVPDAGDTAVLPRLESFAGTSDPRYVVLGPNGWRCQMQVATDGDNALVVFPPPVQPAAPAPDLSTAPIAIENDYLWHGISGTARACTVTTEPAVGAEAKQVSAPSAVPAGRELTPVDSHVTTFVDTNGDRGASWLSLPSSLDAVDGRISILTSAPIGSLTVADCDTIIADWLNRMDAPYPPAPTSTTSTPPGSGGVASRACSVVSANPSAPLSRRRSVHASRPRATRHASRSSCRSARRSASTSRCSVRRHGRAGRPSTKTGGAPSSSVRAAPQPFPTNPRRRLRSTTTGSGTAALAR